MDNTELFTQLQSVENSEERKHIKNIIIENNLGLVYKLARKYVPACKRMEYEDLVQEGTIALMTAVNHFNLENNCEFSTYAYKVIDRQLHRKMHENEHLIAVPEYKDFEWYRNENEEKDIYDNILSLDTPVGEDTELQDYLYEMDDALSNIEREESREKLLYCINDIVNNAKETSKDNAKLGAEVIKYHYGFVDNRTHSFRDISVIMGIPENKVKSLETVFIRQLKEYMRRHNIKYMSLHV